MTRARRRSRRTGGMAMVEMVFVLPLLIFIVFAIAQFGLMFSRWLTLSNAVREGSRAGVSWVGPTCDPTTIENQVKSKVESYARAGGLPLNAVDVNVTNACAGTGTQMTVNSQYPFPITIPFGLSQTITLSYASTMRNE